MIGDCIPVHVYAWKQMSRLSFRTIKLMTKHGRNEVLIISLVLLYGYAKWTSSFYSLHGRIYKIWHMYNKKLCSQLQWLFKWHVWICMKHSDLTLIYCGPRHCSWMLASVVAIDPMSHTAPPSDCNPILCVSREAVLHLRLWWLWWCGLCICSVMQFNAMVHRIICI